MEEEPTRKWATKSIKTAQHQRRDTLQFESKIPLDNTANIKNYKIYRECLPAPRPLTPFIARDIYLYRYKINGNLAA